MAAFITDLRSVIAGIIWSPALIMGGGAAFAPVAAPFPYIIVPPFLSGESGRSEVFLSGEWNSFPPFM